MFSKQRNMRNQNKIACQIQRIQRLEPRTMLAALSFGECGANEVTAQLDAGDSNVATALSFTSQRFRRPAVQAPTTEQLGELDDDVSLNGSNSFYDRIDRYEFEVSEDGQLNLDLEFNRNTFARVAIFDQSRTAVASESLRRDSLASITADLEAGQYTAIVFGGFGRYELNLEFTPEIDEAPTNDPGSTQPDPVPVDEGDLNPEPVSDPVPDPVPTPQTELPEASYYGSNLDWNLNSVNAPEAWQAGYRGDGVVVAVIDTGININHSDLNDNVWVNTDEIAGDGIDNDGNGYVDDRYGWNFVGNNANVNDDNGHGTHVAGSVAAEQNGFGATGVAPDAEVMAIKVLDRSGSGFVSLIANGIRYAVDNGADIINLSLGGGFSSAIASAISYAASNDVLVVAASGNESSSVPGNPASLSSSYSNVLSVGAYDSNGRVASFSNGVGRSGAVQVDAPGVNIYSTAANGGYTWLSGTSMATPHVAGLAALTLSANSNLTAASLRNIIVQTSNRSASGSDAQGVVNASLAIPQAINGTASSSSNGVSTSTFASNGNNVSLRGRALALSGVANLPDLSFGPEATSTHDEIRLVGIRSVTADSINADSGVQNGLSDAASADEVFGSLDRWMLV